MLVIPMMRHMNIEYEWFTYATMCLGDIATSNSLIGLYGPMRHGKVIQQIYMCLKVSMRHSDNHFRNMFMWIYETNKII